jgi:hypothetical protein
MFEHWRQLTYFDNEASVFPSDDLLDELHIHDTFTRKYIAKVFDDLTNDFNAYLLERGIYDVFHARRYEMARVNNAAVLFY